VAFLEGSSLTVGPTNVSGLLALSPEFGCQAPSDACSVDLCAVATRIRWPLPFVSEDLSIGTWTANRLFSQPTPGAFNFQPYPMLPVPSVSLPAASHSNAIFATVWSQSTAHSYPFTDSFADLIFAIPLPAPPLGL
jgi:hypothetical protein